MPYLASFFDAMSGVKNLINFMHATNVVQFLQTGGRKQGWKKPGFFGKNSGLMGFLKNPGFFVKNPGFYGFYRVFWVL